ncbi:ubiquitin-conjugating enzyme E2 J2 isoform X1 [Procambarus clarkii]|uniref:ubiquitin-conjugating enzyme E2 J2 isoform X1 n=1 Tax=Procambarus clarkii TaxID=6728 RepID=UPI001E676E73|nr:ubiquitin-conjugating enzyme E2 J2-like isoform X1 [Procambarus clarkii]
MSKHSGTASARLRADYMRIKRDPVPYVMAEPLPSNILEWHYVVEGPEQSPYEGGYYHGKLVFPMEYPFRPPSIYMITPSGRFKTNTRLCLSISDFHPDTWNPAWSVATILTGLLSFMLEKSPTFGSIETSDYEKRQLAQQSLSFNLKDKVFTELFADMAEIFKYSCFHELERRICAKKDDYLEMTISLPGGSERIEELEKCLSCYLSSYLLTHLNGLAGSQSSYFFLVVIATLPSKHYQEVIYFDRCFKYTYKNP